MKELEEKLDEVLDKSEAARLEAQALREELHSANQRVDVIDNRVKQERRQRRWNRLLLAVLLVLAFMNFRNGQAIRDCTTKGPNTPTAANHFKTGHKCYDRGRSETGKAVSQITDTNKNNVPDTQEILDILKPKAAP